MARCAGHVVGLTTLAVTRQVGELVAVIHSDRTRITRKYGEPGHEVDLIAVIVKLIPYPHAVMIGEEEVGKHVVGGITTVPGRGIYPHHVIPSVVETGRPYVAHRPAYQLLAVEVERAFEAAVAVYA